LSKALIKFFASLRARGAAETLRNIYVGYLQVNYFLVFHLNLERLNVLPEIPGDVVIRRLSSDELDAIRLENPELPFEFHCDQVFGFQTAFVAFVNNKVAAIHWLVHHGEFSRFLSLSSSDVEINYNIVLPEFRGRRLAQILMTELIRAASAKGMRRMFGVVHVVNVQQLKPMLDLGFRPVEVLKHFGPWRPKAKLQFLKQ